MATNMNDAYPVQFDVDYSESRNRLTTFFRIILAIPVMIVSFLVWQIQSPLGLIAALSIIFVGKYPRWIFDAYLELQRFTSRFNAYLWLLVDEYPSIDQENSVHLSIEYPDVETELNRFMPLIKWLLAIPHYILMIIMILIWLVIFIIAWFAILILGHYPRTLFNIEVGIYRYGQRVNAYAFMLATDRYPPFSLSA